MALTATDAEELAEGVDRLVVTFFPPKALGNDTSAIEVEVNTADLPRVSEGLETVGYTVGYVSRWLD